MLGPALPLTRDVVLIGGGHTHALVLRMWGMNPVAGARLTLINPGPTAPYSGMLPGHVAGHYTQEQLEIDLVRLARFAGARLIFGAAEGIDLAARTVSVPGRPAVGFDLCSVDIGITSAMPDLPGFAEHGVPAKPLGPFASAWRGFLDADGPAVVIGAGVAGIELSMAMAHALKSRGRDPKVAVIDRGRALAGTGDRARARLLEAIEALGVTVLENAPTQSVAADKVTLGDGREIASRFTAGAAGARPQGWLAETGLDTHEGFLTVGPTLQTSDPAIFATGDCAHLSHDPRPKAGVFAVREAPDLYRNLRAALTGGDMRAYRPQKDYLKLISLGAKSALAERHGVALSGSLMWQWKDRIDRRFMAKFDDLPTMAPPPLPALRTRDLADALGEKPMCGGCGAKVGRETLRAAMGAPEERADLVALPGDDAALVKVGGARQVMTTDHLRAMTADPVVMTRIAAVHALGDIWAMGARPQAATATLILPRQTEALQTRILSEIMETARTVMREAGAEIVGGHTSQGDELTIGFTITGLCQDDPITLAGGRPGDVLILTKPIGSGVLMAAEMQGRAKGAWVEAALSAMVQPQGDAAAVLGEAHAMTDVTGFGLLGHVLNICEASGTGARIEAEAVPLMEGALELSRDGIASTLLPSNRMLVPGLPAGPLVDLLFDPQTAGGLLAAVDPAEADAIMARLRSAGYPAARIGELTEKAGAIELL